MGEVLAQLNNRGQTIKDLRVTPAKLAALLDMVRAGEISNSAAKTIFTRMSESGEAPALVADREGLRQVGDDSQLSAWIDEVLKANPDEANRYLGGEKKLADGEVHVEAGKPTLIELPIKDKVQGAARVTLFSQKQEPLAERLVYHGKGQDLKVELTADKKRYSPRDPVKVKIKATDPSGKPVKANVGVAVVDDGGVA